MLVQMPEALVSFLYGAVGGGVVASMLRVMEQYWVAPRFSTSAEAKRKLMLYGRPLYLSCHQLEFRLLYINSKLGDVADALRCSPSQATSMDWFGKNGYYSTSSAYVIASVAAWISLYQRDVVFLPFRDRTLAADFFNLIERFKVDLSTDTILWYHYIDGIGELLVEPDHDRPMAFSTFSKKLLTDADFRTYYDQLFQFLHHIAAGQYHKQIERTLQSVNRIKAFLAENDVVPTINAYEHLPET